LTVFFLNPNFFSNTFAKGLLTAEINFDFFNILYDDFFKIDGNKYMG